MMRPGLDFTGINVGYLCHDNNGRILLHQRSANCRDEHFTWDGGGGRVNFGERYEDALLREIKEEYGCDVIQYSLVGQLELFRAHNDRPTHWVANIYVALVDPVAVNVMEPEKNLGNAWHALNDLPQPMHSGVALYLNQYADVIKSLITKHISHAR